jgi:hypothetical protein
MKYLELGHHVVGLSDAERTGEGWHGMGLGYEWMHSDAELTLFAREHLPQHQLFGPLCTHWPRDIENFKITKICLSIPANAYQKIFPPRFHLLDRELAESTLVILRTIKKAYPGEGIRRTVLWLQ